MGYILTVFFSVLLNDLTMIPWQTISYLALFAFQAHIAGEIMDIEPDLLAKKKTTATLAIFSVWMLLDVFIFFKEKPYSLTQMKLFGFAMNISAIASMIWVLYSGKLLHPVF